MVTISVLHIGLFLLVLLLVCCKANQQGLYMQSRSQKLFPDVGQRIVLECQFHYPGYSLFFNPLLWLKSQRNEVIQVNMMRNVEQPFRDTGRFEVTFTEHPPEYNLSLIISDVTPEDSGDYTCEVKGPQSAVEGSVTHHVFVKENVKRVILTTDNTAVIPMERHYMDIYRGPSNQMQTLTFREGHPTPLKCISVGGYPPPLISISLGYRNITYKFQPANRTVLKGQRGLRLMEQTTEQWTNNFIAYPRDDGLRMTCSVSVFGFHPKTTVVRINVNYGPNISCYPASAFIGERNKSIRCEIRAKPPPTEIYWIIDSNRTKVAMHQVVDNHWVLDTEHSESFLYIRRVKKSHFHEYTLVARNAVSEGRASVQLFQRFTTTMENSASVSKRPGETNEVAIRRVHQPGNTGTTYRPHLTHMCLLVIAELHMLITAR